jgi:hypothetical protein
MVLNFTNDKPGRMSTDVAVDYFKITYRYIREGTKQDHEKFAKAVEIRTRDLENKQEC